MNMAYSAASPLSSHSSVWQTRLIGILLALALAGFATALNRDIAGPMIQADEGSHLANAAAVAGFENDMAGSYHAGYSIFISPAFLMGHGPDRVWKTTLLINGLLVFLLCIGLWQLAGKLIGDDPAPKTSERIFRVLLVGAYPMWVVMAGYVFAQLAFATVFVWAVLFLCKAITDDRWWQWLFFGVLAGYTYWTHPVGLVCVLAALLACLSQAITNKRLARPVFAATCLALMVLAYNLVFVPWLHARTTISSTPALHYPGIRETFSALLSSPAMLGVYLARFSGHIFYLLIGTVGVFYLGVADSVRRMAASITSARKGHGNGQLSIQIFLLFSLVGILALSTLLFTTTPAAQRLDHWMYGRYVEGVLAPLLLVGASHRHWRKLIWSIPLSAAALLLLLWGMEPHSGNAPMNTSALWQQLQMGSHGMWLWWLAGSGLIVLAAAFGKTIGKLIVSCVFCFASWQQVEWHQVKLQDVVPRWESARYVRANYPRGTCVGFDMTSVNNYNQHSFWFDYGFQLYDYRLMRSSIPQWTGACKGLLFSFNPGVRRLRSRAEIVWTSPKQGPTLWTIGAPPPIEYPLDASRHTTNLGRVLAEGWHGIEPDHVWSTDTAQLRLPSPIKCIKAACKVLLKFGVFAASPLRPVEITLSIPTEGGMQSQTYTYTSNGPHTVAVPLSTHPYTNVSIQAPDAVSPSAIAKSADNRELGISLLSITLENGPTIVRRQE